MNDLSERIQRINTRVMQKLKIKKITKQNVIIVSGYFNPLHKGHIEYFIHAKAKGDQLFVIVNNDNQGTLKGSKAFQCPEIGKVIVRVDQ
jgi:cytidyltransferase-like protein